LVFEERWTTQEWRKEYKSIGFPPCYCWPNIPEKLLFLVAVSSNTHSRYPNSLNMHVTSGLLALLAAIMTISSTLAWTPDYSSVSGLENFWGGCSDEGCVWEDIGNSVSWCSCNTDTDEKYVPIITTAAFQSFPHQMPFMMLTSFM
jgi:hypothetical protein